MKETQTGLESETNQEAAIISSGQFKRILENDCHLQVTVVMKGDKAVFETTNAVERAMAKRLVTDISMGRLIDKGDGVI